MNEQPVDFNIYNGKETFEKLKSQIGFPANYFNEIFILAKSTDDKDIRKVCTDIIKKQAPDFMKEAFKCRKKFTLKTDGKSNSNRLLSLFEFANYSDELDIGKMYKLMSTRECNLWLDDASVINAINQKPALLGRLNGLEKLIINNDSFPSGEIPNSITLLSSLKELQIKGSYKSLPEEFGALKNLEHLEFELPNIQSIPNSIENLRALKTFTFSGSTSFSCFSYNSDIQDFNWLTKLTNLKKLELSFFNVNSLYSLCLPLELEELEILRMPNLKSLPENIGELKKLKELSLCVLENLEKLPDSIKNLKDLKTCELKKIPKIDKIPGELIFGHAVEKTITDKHIEVTPVSTISKRTNFFISNVNYLHYLLNNAEYFPELEEVHLDRILEVEPTKYGLGALKKLKHIKLGNIGDIPTIFKDIEQCKQLESIWIYGSGDAPENTLTTLPEAFSEIKHLQKLTIQTCKNLIINTDYLPRHIEDCNIRSVKEIVAGKSPFSFDNISISQSPILNIEVFNQQISSKVINIDYAYPDVAVIESLKNVDIIKGFYFRGEQKDVGPLLQKLKNLEKLKLIFPEGKEVSSSDLTSYSHPNLTDLNIKNFTGNTDEFQELLKNTPNLKFLFISNCKGVSKFPKVSLPFLKTFNIYSSDIASLEELDCPQITTFRTSFCNNFGNEAIRTVSNWKNLTELWLAYVSNGVNEYPESIAELPLHTLYLQGKFQMGAIPKFLGKIKTLHTLHLNGFSVDSLPIELTTLTNLEQLDINSTWFKNKLPEEFKNLKLKKLGYYMSKFSGNNLKKELYEPLLTPSYTSFVKKLDSEEWYLKDWSSTEIEKI
ncbi:leucine-rich repeat domain-containing protein [Chondrinema litorale]|uniref:leucine-rich repeat domain-containing protein n=1 Tax=Chondrinema litorale TaxID=2994555 RepID=UPI00254368FA|nr:hypothetical protein [Chondrinema litorale]UZR97091.1 hypothetical protein OQ292_23615 [Chondrinema litorale]